MSAVLTPVVKVESAGSAVLHDRLAEGVFDDPLFRLFEFGMVKQKKPLLKIMYGCLTVGCLVYLTEEFVIFLNECLINGCKVFNRNIVIHRFTGSQNKAATLTKLTAQPSDFVPDLIRCAEANQILYTKSAKKCNFVTVQLFDSVNIHCFRLHSLQHIQTDFD